MKIQDNFVNFELAKRLKELGFDEECFASYDMEDPEELFIGFDEYDGEIFNREYYIPAPLHQQVLQWLREVHNIYVITTINPYSTDIKEVYVYKIYTDKTSSGLCCIINFEDCMFTFEQALQEGINQALTLIETK